MLHELAKSTSKRLLFYCAFGERSAMAVQAAQDAGLATRLPHPGRHRRLEEGQRAAGAFERPGGTMHRPRSIGLSAMDDQAGPYGQRG